MRTFYLLLGITLAFDAALLVWLAWAFRAPAFARHRISASVKLKVSPLSRIVNVIVSSSLSLVAVLGATYFGFAALLTTRATPAWLIALQAIGILLVYDFAYYGLHRGMHHKKLMRWVHGVHHRAKTPSALESFYLHPLELLAGLGLLLASAWLVGPVHVYAFAAAFFVYSTLNISIHSGLDFGKRWLAPIDALTRKHHVHHHDDFGKNYASLTPLPDWLFGTSG